MTEVPMNWYKTTPELNVHGLALNHARVEKFSQKDVAEKLDSEQPIISRIERGYFIPGRNHVSEKTVDLIHRFADLVGIPRFDFGTPVSVAAAHLPSGVPVKQRLKASVRGPGAPRVKHPQVAAIDNTLTPPNSISRVDTVDADVRDTVLLALLDAVAKGSLQPHNALNAIKKQF
jgi:hypothetical protein